MIYSGRREGGKGTPVLVDFLDTFRRRTGRDVDLVMTGSGPVDVPATLAPAFHDLGFVTEEEKRERGKEEAPHRAPVAPRVSLAPKKPSSDPGAGEMERQRWCT